jgi:putative transposase
MGAGAVHSIKSAHHAQRFLSTHSRIHDHFQLRRHRLTATEYRTIRDLAFTTWRDSNGLACLSA